MRTSLDSLTRTPRAARWPAVFLFSLLPFGIAAPAAAQAGSTTPPSDVLNEYRFTVFPSYAINEKTMGFGYLGYVSKPESDYVAYYLGAGAFFRPVEWVQIWGGLISIYTDLEVKSNLLELRPFTGLKFMGSNAKTKWRYSNWTRYELRFTDSLATHDWTTVQRIRNQTRLEIPLGPTERAWTLKSWYLFGDVEPIYRSDTGQIDPLRLRAGLGWIAKPRLVVEFHWYVQYTRPDGGSLEYTDNILRLNFKLLTAKGVLSGLSADYDD